MDIRVDGTGSPDPFLGAGSLLETEHDLSLPVEVQIRPDPDERTLAAHYDDRHVLRISQKAATSAMARELALHELAHMVRYENDHPSHTQSTDEALFLALAGQSVERRKVTHCYQIANHMKDIYADDITLSVAPAEKLVTFLESRLASALADHTGNTPYPETAADTTETDPEISVVNAAFALAVVERHDLVDADHRIYDLAAALADAAPGVDLDLFRERFVSLTDDPSESNYRKELVDVTRAYAAESTAAGPAAD
ncbi:MAG: hypothetical protein J07HB67_01091 [halophilic archaeon J07HB67]|jgi:hypothetical protein|nr:MAG: hypothetical protein J07HB67_01091 [halophilic archaeon J07HB67]